MENPTIEEFKQTLEIMRKAYPFEDNRTVIENTIDYATGKNTVINLMTLDDNGTEVRLSKNISGELPKI